MTDHNHWWTFCFYLEPERRFYFTELPCGAGDKEIGIEMARIVAENVEVFGPEREGKCSPRQMPEGLDHCPESMARRLLTRDEIRHLCDADDKLS